MLERQLLRLRKDRTNMKTSQGFIQLWAQLTSAESHVQASSLEEGISLKCHCKMTGSANVHMKLRPVEELCGTWNSGASKSGRAPHEKQHELILCTLSLLSWRASGEECENIWELYRILKMYPPVDVDRFYRCCKGTFKVFEDWKTESALCRWHLSILKARFVGRQFCWTTRNWRASLNDWYWITL